MPARTPSKDVPPTWRDRARRAEYWLVGALIAAGWLQFLWGALRALAGWLGY